MTEGCGASAGGVAAEDVDLRGQTVVRGRVMRAQAPVATAYVRLLDSAGEFAGEVPTDAEGGFRFYAAPGAWTVRALAPGGGRAEQSVVAERGVAADVELAVG